ncbi:hypothetical protein [Streptomyces carminius]|nr:hypothetical protein [Streptomyces carminius]
MGLLPAPPRGAGPESGDLSAVGESDGNSMLSAISDSLRTYQGRSGRDGVVRLRTRSRDTMGNGQ